MQHYANNSSIMLNALECCLLQRPSGSVWDGEEGTHYEDEEDGARDGGSVWNESCRETTKVEGYWTRCMFILFVCLSVII